MVEEERRGRGGEVGEQESVEESALYDALHREHEEVDQLLERLLRTDDADQRKPLWDELFASMYAHAHAEEEKVYPALRKQDNLRDLAGHAIEEHHEVERMMNEIDGLDLGDRAFATKVREMARAIREHVKEEEQKLLPGARLSQKELTDLARKFAQRRRQLYEAQQRTRSGGGRGGGRKLGIARGRGRGYADKTVEELYAIAKERDIPGRSRMNKDELIKAIKSGKSGRGRRRRA